MIVALLFFYENYFDMIGEAVNTIVPYGTSCTWVGNPRRRRCLHPLRLSLVHIKRG
jgi:hypothetical protein